MFNELKMRQLQKRANAFVKSLDGKSDKEVEQAYLDNKEFTNNEIVLSFLFFKYPSLIRILPLDFQKSRINSNLSMFRSGSIEARKSLVSDWIRDNKFFMNATSIGMDDNEYNSYLKLYFNQKNDIVKLFMDDLRRVVSILYSEDARETEKLISMEASKFTSKQWEFIIKAEPSLIKYAPQDVQNMYSLDEKYIKDFENIIRISAKEEIGLDELKQNIKDLFFSGSIETESLIISNSRHKQALIRALENAEEALVRVQRNEYLDLVSIYVMSSLKALNEITGNELEEDLVNKIFGDFCVGK